MLSSWNLNLLGDDDDNVTTAKPISRGRATTTVFRRKKMSPRHDAYTSGRISRGGGGTGSVVGRKRFYMVFFEEIFSPPRCCENRA